MSLSEKEIERLIRETVRDEIFNLSLKLKLEGDYLHAQLKYKTEQVYEEGVDLRDD